MNNPTAAEVRQILSESKVIAVVGLSDNPARPSYGVASYLKARGYRIFTLITLFSALAFPHRAGAMPIPIVYGGFIVVPDASIPMSGLSQPFWGAIGGPPSIRINPERWAILPEGAQQFLLDHERGHCALGHTARPAPSLQIAAQREWDADTCAATAMLRRGQRALLDQQIRWLRWLALAAPPPAPEYAPWQVQADHLAAIEAAFFARRQ